MLRWPSLSFRLSCQLLESVLIRCGCSCVTSAIIWLVYTCVLLLVLLIIIRVFCLLPIQVAGVKVFIVIGQMGLSVAGVNIGSCAVAVVLHHLLFGEFTHVCFIIDTVIISLFYLLSFSWLVSGLF